MVFDVATTPFAVFVALPCAFSVPNSSFYSPFSRATADRIAIDLAACIEELP